ncbi:TerD family protein [Nostoc sp. HG1]|nr:TerD family protein [Nostoc sp. HG1]
MGKIGLHNSRKCCNVIYFRNLSHKSGAITHLGDNLTGAGAGDDEQILVDLTRLPKEIVKLVFTVNIYDCIARKQEFAQVQNAFVRLVNTSNNQEVAKYHLSGSEYKWRFQAVGAGYKSGLQSFVDLYAA